MYRYVDCRIHVEISAEICSAFPTGLVVVVRYSFLMAHPIPRPLFAIKLAVFCDIQLHRKLPQEQNDPLVGQSLSKPRNGFVCKMDSELV